jgi:hypothetical protein
MVGGMDKLTNVEPVASPDPPARITSAAMIRAALEAAGIAILPHPEWRPIDKPDAWSAKVKVDGEVVDLWSTGPDHGVLRVFPGTLAAGHAVWIEGGRLVVDR